MEWLSVTKVIIIDVEADKRYGTNETTKNK